MQPVARIHRLQPPSAADGVQLEAPEARWQVRLLGAVEASDGVQTITRFSSRAVAALLARLALAPDRAHAREELVELPWPGVDLAVGRNRLRQVLSTLKSLIEPPGVPPTVNGSPRWRSTAAASRCAGTVTAWATPCGTRRWRWRDCGGPRRRCA